MNWIEHYIVLKSKVILKKKIAKVKVESEGDGD